eukprot:GFUD01042987.1.p1 GENE.GFUD01042987.1~~GFUD01042987.1.p1  ORF type:complete len:648 (-),score=215.18 GFUD01042987.1:484-2427(-)
MDVTIACGAGCVAGLATLYRLARPHFSIRVNCHFCNQDSRVAYGQSNSFICPSCEQYNGWDSQGDYNKQLGMAGPGSHCRFVREQRSGATAGNGLCRSCNLNQELKVAQLAKFPRDGRELEEYTDHLEKVYRLCPGCEDVLATKLGDQDRKLANKLIEFRLERSRLNSSVTMVARGPGWWPYIQCVLSIAVFSLLQDYNQFHIPGGVRDSLAPVINSTTPLQLTISSYLDTMFPYISLTEVISPFLLNLPLVLVTTILCMLLVSLYKKSFLNLVLYLCLLVAYCTNTQHIVQLSMAGVGVIIAVMTTPPTPHNTIITSKGTSRLSDSFLQYQTTDQATPPELDDTLTQALLDTSSDSPPPSRQPTPSPSPPQSVAKVFASSPPNTSAPKKTNNEFSFTHEFATQQEGEDCNLSLSSLSLGEIPSSPTPQSPFSLSQYSPCSPSNGLFSPSRLLLYPSRLTNTSWVAGGYWTPPGQTQPQALSRSSSHSSGFVSGTPSLANCPSPPGSLHNYGSPLPVNAIPYSLGYPPPTSDMDRFSVLSEPAYQFPHLPPHPRTYAASVIGSPDPRIQQVHSRRQTLDDRLSDTSMDRHSQMSQLGKFSTPQTNTSSKPGWSLTITITPTGLILATSIAVNVALAVMWLRHGLEGV